MSLTSSDTAQANNYWCIVVAAIFNFITEEDWGELKYRKKNTHTFSRPKRLHCIRLGNCTIFNYFSVCNKMLEGCYSPCLLYIAENARLSGGRNAVLEELNIMVTVGEHPNIIHLIGACTREGRYTEKSPRI